MKFVSCFVALVHMTKAFTPPGGAFGSSSARRIVKNNQGAGSSYSSCGTELNLFGGPPAFNRVLDALIEKKLIDKNTELEMETKLLLGEVTCGISQAVASLGGDVIVGRIEGGGAGKSEDLRSDEVTLGWRKILGKWKKREVLTYTLIDTDKFKSDILRRDDMSNNDQRKVAEIFNSLLLELGGGLTRKEAIFDLVDSVVPFADEAQAERMSKDLQYVPGKALPVTYNSDFNMKTDESFSRIFFNGIAAPLIATSEEVTDPEYLKYGPFVVDMTFLNAIPIRDENLYKQFGVRVHFDENRIVSAIYDSDSDKLYLPGEEGWEEAKFQAKVNAFTLTTVREHLAQTHLIVSNDASREVVKTLHPEHPIRRLLAIFTYNAVSINKSAAEALIGDRSFIHRATPFTFEGMKMIFDHAYESSVAFEPFPKQKIKNPAVEKLATEGFFPYLADGREYYDIVINMVTEWLDKAGDQASDKYARDFYDAMKAASKGQSYEIPDYSHENMIDVISTIIFTVTAYHELIGHVPDYTDSPFKAGFRVARNTPLAIDVQSFYLMALIAGGTSVPAPQLLDYFPNYIGVGEGNEWEKGVWTKFIADMAIQAKKVQEDDRARNSDLEFKYFDPTLFECSVSV